MDFSIMIFQIVVLIFSAMIHEYMHGWMANYLGDPTAKNMGRLTMNPIAHIDPIGSVLLPFFMIISGMPFVFGWAKPVPFNPYNLRDAKYGSAKVAVAGAMGNFIVALVFGLALRFLAGGFAPAVVFELLTLIVYINLILGVFNLMPIPPLDGSKVIAPFLPVSWQEKMAQFEQYGLIFLFIFVFFAFQIIFPIVNFLFKLIVL